MNDPLPPEPPRMMDPGEPAEEFEPTLDEGFTPPALQAEVATTQVNRAKPE
jgi:hypothetical protein